MIQYLDKDGKGILEGQVNISRIKRNNYSGGKLR